MLGRAPRSKEASTLAKFLGEQRAHYKANADEVTKLLKVGLRPAQANLDPVELAAWTQLCRVLLNVH